MKVIGQRFTDAEKLRSYSTSLSKVDITIGSFYPFEIIVKKEGGFRSPSAVRAAVTRCMKCLAMGEPFIEMNEHSERLEFMFVKKRKLDVFERRWEEKSKENVKKEA